MNRLRFQRLRTIHRTAHAAMMALILALATSFVHPDERNPHETIPDSVNAAVASLVTEPHIRSIKRTISRGEVRYTVKGTGQGTVFTIKVTDTGRIIDSSIRSTVNWSLSPRIELPAEVTDSLSQIPWRIRINDADFSERDCHYRMDGGVEGTPFSVVSSEDGTLLQWQFEDLFPIHRFTQLSIEIRDLPELVIESIEESFPDTVLDEASAGQFRRTHLYFVGGSHGDDGQRVQLIVSEFGEIISFKLDSDGDGIADLGESAFGCDPQRFDSDGDRIPDGFEIDQGTDPLNGDAVPQILSIELRHGGHSRDTVILKLATFRGSEFVLEHCPQAQDWQSMGIAIVGDNEMHEVSIPVAEAEDCGFFSCDDQRTHEFWQQRIRWLWPKRGSAKPLRTLKECVSILIWKTRKASRSSLIREDAGNSSKGMVGASNLNPFDTLTNAPASARLSSKSISLDTARTLWWNTSYGSAMMAMEPLLAAIISENRGDPSIARKSREGNRGTIVAIKVIFRLLR